MTSIPSNRPVTEDGPSPQPSPTPGWGRGGKTWAAVALLLLLHIGLSLSAVRTKTVTFDETAHLPGGLAYWTTNQYDFNPENGNLPQRWATWALALQGYDLPPVKTKTGEPAQAAQPRSTWELGQEIIFGKPGAAERILFWARASMILLSVGTGLIIYFWSRRLFGTAGGLASLALFALCPNFLAHGPLVASDAASALFFLAAVGAMWLLLHRVSLGMIALAGLALGGLCLAKMSAVLWLPMTLLTLGVRIGMNRPLPVKLPRLNHVVTARAQQALWLAGGLLLVLVIAWGVIWAAYGFRFTANTSLAGAEGLSLPGWDWVLSQPGAATALARSARDWKLAPEAYSYGFAYALKSAGARSAFLNGEFSTTGWRHFFPYAFLIKTPLASLGMLLLAALAGVGLLLQKQGGLTPAWRGKLRRGLYRTAPLWIFLFIYWGAAITSHLNIGFRHMLPALAGMYVLAGAAGRWLTHARPALRWGTMLLLLILGVEMAALWPHYLAYFNPLAGGPAQGYRQLVDSSLDWGQDLPGLKQWLEEARHAEGAGTGAREPVYISYFGNGNLQYYGLDAHRILPGFHLPNQTPPIMYQKLEPGLYCISATLLQGVYWSYAPGPRWTAEYEARYRLALPLVEEFMDTAGQPAARQKLLEARGWEYWLQAVEEYRSLRMARLCAYLRMRQPEAMIGYSIFIYRLTDSDLSNALWTPGMSGKFQPPPPELGKR